MNRHFAELLSALNAEGVRYLIVGGYAVSLHAQPRLTKDLDILVEATAANASLLFQALAKFGAPLAGLRPGNLIEAGSIFRMGNAPVMVDILPEIAGVTFSEAHARRTIVPIDEETTEMAHYISAADLIVAKRASGRPQDLADIDALEAAQRASPASPPNQ